MTTTMRRVMIDLRRDDVAGSVPVTGHVQCVPTRRRDDAESDAIRLPAGFTAPLVGGQVEVLLEPTGPDWCWKVSERTSGGIVRHVLVPAGDPELVLAYRDLVDVDPATLEPTESAVPAWDAAVSTVRDYASDAASSMTLARGHADDAENWSLAAAQTALTVEDARTAAEDFARDAESAASAASGSAVSAGEARDEAQSARDEATTAKADAEAARDDAAQSATTASTARDEAVAAAETAAVDAVAAVQDETEAVRDETVTARDAAIAAKDASETARDASVAAKDLAVAAKDATLTAVVIVGVGRPDVPATLTTPGTAALVAAATSGAEFRSIDGPQGAWVWRKRGASWVCTEGDTGWRRYDPPLIGDQFANVAFFIRRVNSQVTLSLQFDGAVTASVTYASYIPTGYKYRYRISATYVPITSTAAGGYIYLIENGNLYLRGYATGVVRTELTWSTNEAWPTTLPGTAA